MSGSSVSPSGSELTNPILQTSGDDPSQCIISIWRAFANDFTDPPTYSDNRVKQLVNAAAFLVNGDLCGCPSVSKPTGNFCTMDTIEVLPDYPSFANLVVLKSLCILDQGLARTKASADGIRATCGPATLQVVSSSNSFSLLFSEGPCAAYKELKDELCFKCPLQSAENCAQILGPFVSDNFIPCGTITSRSSCFNGAFNDNHNRRW